MKRARTDMACFDVRGVQFFVPYDVLRASPPGILRDIVEDVLVLDAPYVLDRDPHAFVAIVQALRRETVLVPANSTRAEVLRECEFFFAEPQPYVWRASAYELAAELKRVYPRLKADIIARVSEKLVESGQSTEASDEVGTIYVDAPCHYAWLQLWSNGTGGLSSLDILFVLHTSEQDPAHLSYFEEIYGNLLSYYLQQWPSELDMIDALNGIIGTERGYISSANSRGTRVIRLETNDENGSLLKRINTTVANTISSPLAGTALK